MATSPERTSLYRTIWRWHFYAGMFVVPMVLILAVTGAVYLFKPQVERWEERAYAGFPTAGTVTADDQVKAALAALPGTKFHTYRLPQAQGDAALVHVSIKGGQSGPGMRDVFVSPQGKVVGVLDPEWRIMQIAHDVHGELLLGQRGSWIVELAASWAIVMILTGLYLWWPQATGLAGVVWPRLRSGKRVFWRDLHAVTGFWVAGLALVLLITGLPWASAWGSAFKAVRTELGWIKGRQDWTIGGKAADADEHAGHDHAAMMAEDAGMPMPMDGAMPGMNHDHAMHGMAPATLNEIVVRAESEHLPFPVIVTPPGMPGAFGAKPSTTWSVRSDTQNRPQRVSLSYDATTGQETSRDTFADKHVVDRIVGYGVAWHEGQLFGWVNQLIGVLTALMLVTLAVSGFVLWRRRKPADLLGAPPQPPVPARLRGVAAIVLVLAALLPLLAASLIVLWAVERLVLARIPAAARWLGLAVRAPSAAA